MGAVQVPHMQMPALSRTEDCIQGQQLQVLTLISTASDKSTIFEQETCIVSVMQQPTREMPSSVVMWPNSQYRHKSI